METEYLEIPENLTSENLESENCGIFFYLRPVKFILTSTWDWIILSFNAVGIICILIMMGCIQGKLINHFKANNDGKNKAMSQNYDQK